MQLYKQVMTKYYPDSKLEDAFNVYGMATAWSMVDVLKKAGPNLTRQAVLDQLNALSETENPFMYPGIKIQTGPSDYFPIEKTYMLRFKDGHWNALAGLVDARE